MKLRPAMASMANPADVSAGPQLRPRPAVRAWRLGRGLWRGVVTLAFAVGLAGCERPTAERWQGYIEGEYVYVASPLGGTLEQLAVQRGAQVRAGDALFRLEDVPERTARDQAGRLLAQAQATVADLKQGRRPSELEALDASLKQAVAALELAEKELARQVKLIQDAGVTSQQAVDQARAARDQARERVAQLTAELATARLGARPDQIAAAEASAGALAAALQQAEWNLATEAAGRAAGGCLVLRHALSRGRVGGLRSPGGLAAAAGRT
jgi:HlyD family secretion protein